MQYPSHKTREHHATYSLMTPFFGFLRAVSANHRLPTTLCVVSKNIATLEGQRLVTKWIAAFGNKGSKMAQMDSHCDCSNSGADLIKESRPVQRTYMTHKPISTPELFPWLRERQALGNPETKCLLIGFSKKNHQKRL